MTYGLHKVDICYIAEDMQNVSRSKNQNQINGNEAPEK